MQSKITHIDTAKDTANFIKKNRLALKKWNLKKNDKVELSSGKKFVISSMTSNGKLYFKGGRGSQSWAANVINVIP